MTGVRDGERRDEVGATVLRERLGEAVRLSIGGCEMFCETKDLGREKKS